MAEISEWLQIMLAEIARKQEELERAREEDSKRSAEKVADVTQPTPTTKTSIPPSTTARPQQR